MDRALRSLQAQHSRQASAAASPCHWFGTDNLGRDIFSRIIMGSRIALIVGISTIGIALVHRARARADSRLRPALARQSPDAALQFRLLVSDRHHGPDASRRCSAPASTTLMFVVILVQTPAYARLTRTATLSLKNSEYVQADPHRLAPRPCASSPCTSCRTSSGRLLIIASMDIPSVVALEAGLTYLGMGIPPPAPSWGRILQEGYTAHPRGAVDRRSRRHSADHHDARLHLPRRSAARHARSAIAADRMRRQRRQSIRRSVDPLRHRSRARCYRAAQRLYRRSRAARSSALSARAARANRRWRSP